ncbi:MAG TPA: tripartite tricarboxylate transporter substrate-binding protein [Variovorax sp.]
MSDIHSQTRRAALRALGAGALFMSGARVRAEGDDATVTVVVGAASAMDTTARLIAQQLKDSLDRPAIALSKLGAGQRVALAEVRHAAPDGRTLLFATNGPFSIYPHIYTKLEYDPVNDFTPIAGVSEFDVAVATGPATGAADMQQLIDWFRSKGTGAVYGSAPGTGSLSNFVGISISLATHIPMEHVPYKDSGVGIIDLVAGRLPMMITGTQPLAEMHKTGKIRVLAVSGPERSILLPEVPTLKESGINVSSTTFTGLFGPRRMAPELVKKFHDAIAPMFTQPDSLEKFRAAGMTPSYTTGAQLAAALVKESKRFEMLVKASGYVPQES